MPFDMGMMFDKDDNNREIIHYIDAIKCDMCEKLFIGKLYYNLCSSCITSLSNTVENIDVNKHCILCGTVISIYKPTLSRNLFIINCCCGKCRNDLILKERLLNDIDKI